AELDAELAADKKAFWNRGIDRAVAAAGKAFDAGDHARAIAEANTVLLYAPDARGSLPLLRGRAHAAVHAANKTSIDLITARADFLANIPHLPADPWPHVYLAQLHAAGNHAFHAAHHFGKALEIDPDSYAALSGKA